MFSEYELRNEHLTSIKPTTGYPVSRSGFGRGASGIEAQNTVAIPVCKLMTYMTTVLNINFPNVFGFYFLNDTRLDKIRSEVIRKELEISGIQNVRVKYKQNWINHLERMDNTRLPKQALNYKPRGRRDRGLPRKRWQRVDAGRGQTT